MFLPTSNFFDYLVKKKHESFFLDLALKARMIEHAFLGRLRDENATVSAVFLYNALIHQTKSTNLATVFTDVIYSLVQLYLLIIMQRDYKIKTP